MGRSLSFFGALLICLLQWQHINGQCDFSGAAENQLDFPDIQMDPENTKTKLPGYELTVEFTISNADVKETQYFKEYYDIIGERGRLDMVSNGKTSRSYYYKDPGEAFDISEETCVSRDPKKLPGILSTEVMDWDGGDVKGPSAMFLVALKEWKDNRETMKYMGEVDDDDFDIDLAAHYWRRCNGNQVVDYYFTTKDHDDTFGFKKLKNIPLRVEFTKSTQDEKYFPQTYEILSFKPFVSDIISTFRLPTGVGCKRQDKDAPTPPDFSAGNLMTWGEASYVYGSQDDEIWNYYSTFMYAEDKGIQHLAYFYSPWGSIRNDGQEADGYMHVVFDMKNKYVYTRNLATGECGISREKKFLPLYYLPKYGGSISLTDNMMLFPNDEFQYISDGKDRGFDVHTFEASMDNFDLGNRTIAKLLVNHNYLKENEVVDNAVQVKNTTVSMRLRFYADKEKPHSEELTISLYGFSTEVQYRRFIFSMQDCFKNDDDYLYAVIGFPADPSMIDKIKDKAPMIERNLMNDIIRLSELNPLRIPYMMTDFSDMVYVTLLLIDKPPVQLDYLDAEKDKTIDGATDVKGIMSSGDCATACLESEGSCWGFSFCGATCYFGTGAVKVKDQKDCELYRRFDTDNYVPSKEKAAENIKQLVDGKQLRLALPSLDDTAQPTFLEATYFAITNPGESDEVFDRFGQKTIDRFRVVKSGFKLVKTGETIKNFGKLRYDQCQSLCLDYSKCETVSYCVRDSQCVLSLTYADDLPQDKIVADNMCNLLARKYADHFTASPGFKVSRTSLKTLKDADPEKCAKACLLEKDFQCMSFDSCPDEIQSGCRLHKVQFLDKNTREGETMPDTSCTHFFKKHSFHFRKEDNRVAVKGGLLVQTNVTVEECAKICNDYADGNCYGYDFCADKYVTASTCTLLVEDPGTETLYSPICTHYLQATITDVNIVPESKAAWVGVVCFFVAAIVGLLLFGGVAYYRANRAQ